MIQNKELVKKRIKSIDATFKITKAVELVSIVKLKKLINIITPIKTYATSLYDVCNNLLLQTSPLNQKVQHQLLNRPTLWIVISADLGFCGSYIHNLHQLLEQQVAMHDQLICFGTKIIKFIKHRHWKNTTTGLPGLTINNAHDLITKIVVVILTLQATQAIYKIKLIYTTFINTVTFVKNIRQLWPLMATIDNHTDQTKQITFEPHAQQIITNTISLYLYAVIYGAAIESITAEHCSRRLTMENASKNAGELLETLKLSYNKIRQNEITKSVLEIVNYLQNQDHETEVY